MNLYQFAGVLTLKINFTNVPRNQFHKVCATKVPSSFLFSNQHYVALVHIAFHTVAKEEAKSAILGGKTQSGYVIISAHFVDQDLGTCPRPVVRVWEMSYLFWAVKSLITNFHFYEKKRMDKWVPAGSTGSPGNKSPQKSIIWTVDASCPLFCFWQGLTL